MLHQSTYCVLFIQIFLNANAKLSEIRNNSKIKKTRISIFHLESHYLLVDDLRMNSISSLSNYFIKFFEIF